MTTSKGNNLEKGWSTPYPPLHSLSIPSPRRADMEARRRAEEEERKRVEEEQRKKREQEEADRQLAVRYNNHS